MNKFKTILAALLIATAATACSRQEEPMDNNVTVVQNSSPSEQAVN